MHHFRSPWCVLICFFFCCNRAGTPGNYLGTPCLFRAPITGYVITSNCVSVALNYGPLSLHIYEVHHEPRLTGLSQTFAGSLDMEDIEVLAETKAHKHWIYVFRTWWPWKTNFVSMHVVVSAPLFVLNCKVVACTLFIFGIKFVQFLHRMVLFIFFYFPNVHTET